MRRAARRSAELVEVTVESLGAGGDGLARQGGARLFVPFSLPGERWRVRLGRRVEEGWLTEPVELLDAGEGRVLPPCPYFGSCGGCRLQHLPADAYAAFKVERVRAALAQRGLADVPIEPVRVAPLGSRRRLRMALIQNRGAVRLGYRRRGSTTAIAVDRCPIAEPVLQALFPPLAAGLSGTLSAPLPAELSLTATATGIDLLLHAERLPTLDERQDLAALASTLDLARVSWEAGPGALEPIAERRRPIVRLGGIEVGLPPSTFLQATRFGEEELAAAMLAWGEGATAAADLYAGLGTLGLPLAARLVPVHAVEAARPALAALAEAASRHRLPLTTEPRDLARRPLAGSELDRFDLVLLDPPRAGALVQAEALARAKVRRLVYASCNPASFARDARVLVDGGWRLVSVRPIDQFLFSHEIELVALFARA